MSVYGALMYALSAIGAVLVVAEVFEQDLGLGTFRLYLMFGSLLLAMMFAGVETARSSRIAEQRVGKVR